MYSFHHDPVHIARTLVSIPSESSNPVGNYRTSHKGEKAVMDYLYSLAISNGIKAELDMVFEGRPNLYLHFPRPTRPKIFFDGHMDTVSGANMIVEPFGGIIEDEKLWGRGACDSKAGAAALMSVLLESKLRGKILRYDVTVAFTVDEESGFGGAQRVRATMPAFDFGIVFEPTNFQIITAHKGVLRCKIQSKGIAAHSSTPNLGENAIYKMVPLLLKLQQAAEKLADTKDELLGSPTLSVNMINGGIGFNIVPDTCAIEVDIRLLPETDNQKMIIWLKELIGPEFEVEIILSSSGFRNNQETEQEKAFIRLHQQMGVAVKKMGTAFATDCCEISELGPCIIWGPGDIRHAHTKDEHISIHEIQTAAEVLKNFLFEN